MLRLSKNFYAARSHVWAGPEIQFRKQIGLRDPITILKVQFYLEVLSHYRIKSKAFANFLSDCGRTFRRRRSYEHRFG